jgi:UDP-glucose 4-epimerase
MKKIKKALVTGGCGFIGSHVVAHLADALDVPVVAIDNLSTGFRENLESIGNRERVSVVEDDLLVGDKWREAFAGVDTVFHFQANADVRGGIKDTAKDIQQNILATHRVCEAAREAGVRQIVFASSAAVYGEPDVFPTPESYAPLQTSIYGASKLACEAILQAYTEYYGIRTASFRFVSWIGPRYSHGVIFDFYKKLLANSAELEILGNGKQRKSYLDVADGIAAIMAVALEDDTPKAVYNVGHDEFLDVDSLAGIVLDELGMHGTHLRHTGGERGWLGDSPFVHLDTAKLKALGWKPTLSIEEGIRRTVGSLRANRHLMQRN